MNLIYYKHFHMRIVLSSLPLAIYSVNLFSLVEIERHATKALIKSLCPPPPPLNSCMSVPFALTISHTSILLKEAAA